MHRTISAQRLQQISGRLLGETSLTFRCLCCQITSAFCAALDLLVFLTTFMNLQLICWILCRMIFLNPVWCWFWIACPAVIVKETTEVGGCEIRYSISCQMWSGKFEFLVIIIIYRALTVDIDVNRLQAAWRRTVCPVQPEGLLLFSRSGAGISTANRIAPAPKI